MPFRTELKAKTYVGGRPFTVMVVDNPTIDDVLVTEMRLYAADIMNDADNSGRRVSRDVRDILIRLGVER